MNSGNQSSSPTRLIYLRMAHKPQFMLIYVLELFYLIFQFSFYLLLQTSKALPLG